VADASKDVSKEDVSKEDVSKEWNNAMSTFEEFRDSTSQAQDYAALRAIYDADGYLFLRAQLPAQALRLVTEQLIYELVRQDVISAHDHTAVHSPEQWPDVDDDAIHAHVDYETLWHDPQTLALFEGLLGEAPWVFKQTIVRSTAPNRAIGLTPPHQCSWFIQPNDDFRILWTPLVPVNLSIGGLAVAPGSHKDGAVRHIAYDDSPSLQLPGNSIWGLPKTAIPDYWVASSDFRPGDVLIFHAHTIHKSLPNTSSAGRLRLSLDTRFQPASSERGFMSTHTQPEVRRNPDAVFGRHGTGAAR
jgi:1-deoxypentalenic acid 11beta-hydroxylase